jgi:hypothetical protein
VQYRHLAEGSTCLTYALVLYKNQTHVAIPGLFFDSQICTRFGNVSKLAVRAVIEGEPLRNLEALANPESFEHFRNLVELRS